jgi:hypothetical protein
MTVVIDSLVATGVSREALERLRIRVASGDVAGIFGGGGGQAQPRGGFAERPGEGAFPRRPAGAERQTAMIRDTTVSTRVVGGVAREESGGDVETLDPDLAQDFVRLTRPPGQGGGGGFGGQRQPPIVATGDYLVTLEVGGQRHRQVLRVERVGTTGSAATTTAPQLP